MTRPPDDWGMPDDYPDKRPDTFITVEVREPAVTPEPEPEPPARVPVWTPPPLGVTCSACRRTALLPAGRRCIFLGPGGRPCQGWMR